MHRLSFSEGSPATNELAIARLERKLSVSFPDDYRDFLLTFNGGRPDLPYLRFDCAGADVLRVHFFFGIADPVQSCDLDWNVEITRKTRPKEILPIADDEGGCLFYLRVNGPRKGEVLFGGLPQDGIVSFTHVAGTFSDFLRMLEPEPVE